MKIFLTRFIAEDHGHFDSLAWILIRKKFQDKNLSSKFEKKIAQDNLASQKLSPKSARKLKKIVKNQLGSKKIRPHLVELTRLLELTFGDFLLAS